MLLCLDVQCSVIQQDKLANDIKDILGKLDFLAAPDALGGAHAAHACAS